MNQLTNCKFEYAKRGELVNKLQIKNDDLQRKLRYIYLKLSEAKQYSKMNNLLIMGVPATTSEVTGAYNLRFESSDVTIAKVIDLCNDKLNLSINEHDISVAHRLRIKKQGEHPPIIVRFVRRSQRNAVFNAKRLLKSFNDTQNNNNKIITNEDLIQHNHDLLHTARSYVKKSFLLSAWTFSCKVHVKPTTGNPTVITSLANLASIIHVISPGENVQLVTRTGASAYG